MGRHRRLKLGVAFAFALAVALAVAAVAAADKEKIHYTAAGQVAARAAVITRADLGSAPGWAGGPTKPSPGATLNCPGFQPKQSDLVLIGDAESQWKNGGLSLDSEAQVLQSAKMVQLDWQRTVLAPQLESCLRTTFTRSLPSSATFVSLRRRVFPALTAYARAYRLVANVKTSSGTVAVFVDFVLIGSKQTEISLAVTAPLSGSGAVAAAEVRLAKVLLARARL